MEDKHIPIKTDNKSKYKTETIVTRCPNNRVNIVIKYNIDILQIIREAKAEALKSSS